MSTIFRDPSPLATSRGSHNADGVEKPRGLHKNCHLAPSQDGTTTPEPTNRSSSPSSLQLRSVTLPDAETLAILFDRCFATDPVRLAYKPPHRVDPLDPLEERRWRTAQYTFALQFPTSCLIKAVEVVTDEDGVEKAETIGVAGFFGRGGIQWQFNGEDSAGVLGVEDPKHWNLVAKNEINKLVEKSRDGVLQGNYDVWELAQIFVAPEYRCRGIGRMLVEWGVRQADQEGYPVYVEASPEAKKFYEKQGFTARAETTIPGVLGVNGEPYVLYSMVRVAGGGD